MNSSLLIFILLVVFICSSYCQFSYVYNDPYMQVHGLGSLTSIQYHWAGFGPNFINNTVDYKFDAQLALPNGPLDACTRFPNTTANGESWRGKIVVALRVNCLTGIKTKNVENAGAAATLIVQCDPGPPSFCSNSRHVLFTLVSYNLAFNTINIPTAFITYLDAIPMISALQKNPSTQINVTIPATGPLIDPTGDIMKGLKAFATSVTTLDPGVGSTTLQNWIKAPTDPCIDLQRPYEFICMEGKLIGIDSVARPHGGTIPTEINLITTLEYFTIIATSIKGAIPAFTNLTNVHTFVLQRNTALTSLFDSISTLKNLVVFDLNSCRFSSLPNDFNALNKLRWFSIAGNSISVLPRLATNNLYFLDISNNFINVPLQNFSGSPLLYYFNIANNMITGTNISNFFNDLPALTIVNMASNQLTGPLPNFYNCGLLQTIALDNNQFIGGIPSVWNMPKRCSTNSSILCQKDCDCGAGVCQSLLKVTISNNKLTGSFVFTATSLITLDLSNNQIDPTSTSWGLFRVASWNQIFFNCFPASINDIDLSSNKINGNWDAALFSTTLLNIKSLKLANNSITSLPTSDLYGGSTQPNVFKLLDVSYNKISGVFPTPAVTPATIVIDRIKIQGNPLLTSGVNGVPSWAVQIPPYMKTGVEPYICPTLKGYGSFQFILEADPSFFKYTNCICDRGYYGIAPNCLDIPALVKLNSTNVVSFSDTQYGSSRLTLGVDISWFLSTNISNNGIVKSYNILITRLQDFYNSQNNIIEIYSGDWTLQGKRILSLRGNDTAPLTNLPTAGFQDETQVVLYPNATVVFRSKSLSGLHFIANYTISYECPQNYQFYPTTESCQVLFKLNNAIQITVFSVISIFMVLLLIITTVIVTKRNSLIIRSSSFPFCMSMLIFMILLGIGSYFYAVYPDKGDAICHLRPWLTALPLVGILSALLVKVDRIRRIFTSKELVVQTITNAQLAKTMGLMLCVEIALLIGFSASNMSQSYQTLGYGFSGNQLVYICTSSENEVGKSSFNAWIIIQFIYIALFLLVAVAIAWSVRKVPSAFNEAPSIASSLLSLAVLLIILIPLNYMVDDNPNALMLIRGLGQILVTMVLVLFFFGPKLYLILEGKDNDKTLSSLGSNASSSSQSSSSSANSSQETSSNNEQQIILLIKSLKSMFQSVLSGSFDVSDLKSTKQSLEKQFQSKYKLEIVNIISEIENIICTKGGSQQ